MNAEIVQHPAVSGPDPGPEAPSAVGSLIGVFTEPRPTFAAMTAKPRLLAPLVVLVLFQLVFGIVLAQSGIMKNDTIAKLEAKSAPQEQIDAVTRMMDSPARFVFAAAGPIVLVFSLLISAALLYFMANLMLGGRLRYTHYLCIAAYGAVVGIVDQAVRMGLALNRGTLLVHMGVGAFLGDDLSAPLRVLDTATDPLLLWAVLVQALGVAAMTKKGLGFGLLAVLPGTLILCALSAFQR
jgi:hypothetical protein